MDSAKTSSIHGIQLDTRQKGLCLWAYLLLRGRRTFEQIVKCSIHPGKSYMKQMIQAIFTPAHSDTCKSLRYHPFADTFNHSASNRQPQLLLPLVVNMILMGFQGGHHMFSWLSSLGRTRWCQASLSQLVKDLMGGSVTERMACARKPITCLCCPTIQPHSCGFPEILTGMINVQNSARIEGKLIGIYPPTPSTTVAEPDGALRGEDTLLHGSQPASGLNIVNGSQDGNKTAPSQDGHRASGLGDPLPQPSHNSDLHLPPHVFSLGAPSLRTTRNHDAIVPTQKGKLRNGGGQFFWIREGFSQEGQLLLKTRHRIFPRPLNPFPHRPRTDITATETLEQHGGHPNWHKDGQDTGCPLSFEAGALIRLSPQCLIQGGHLSNLTRVRTAPHPALPRHLPDQAHHRTSHKSLTFKACPTLWTDRSLIECLTPLGQHLFDKKGCDPSRECKGR